MPGFTATTSLDASNHLYQMHDHFDILTSLVVPSRPTCDQCDSQGGPCYRDPYSSACRKCHCACGITSECGGGGGGGGGCPAVHGSCQGAPTGVWGNWCGPGCGNGPACDDVDECCHRHDKCYDKFWGTCYSSCTCDAQLISCLTPKIDPSTPKGRAAAEIVSTFTQKIASGLCNPNPLCPF